MAYKNRKRSAYINKEGLQVGCDGLTIKDRKPDLKLKSNHFKIFDKRKLIASKNQSRSGIFY